MTWSVEIMLHISRSVSSAWTHLWWFHRSSLSIKSYCRKTAEYLYDLKWPWRHEKGSLVAIFWFRMSSVPVIRCLKVFRMVFVPKRRISILFHWLIMERSQNWPDLESPISKFRDMHFMDTVTYINRWKFQGDRPVGVMVAMTSIQTFSELRSLDVTWWPDLEWSGCEICTCADKMYEQVCQKTAARKTLRGRGVQTPSRHGAGWAAIRWCLRIFVYDLTNIFFICGHGPRLKIHIKYLHLSKLEQKFCKVI